VAYEDYINHITPNESKPTELHTKNDDLNEDYNKILQENYQLKESLENMRAENERLNQMIQRMSR